MDNNSNAFERLQCKLMQRAYGFVDGGIYDRNQWMESMTDLIIAHGKKLSISDRQEAWQLAEQYWDSKFTVGHETYTIAVWAARKEYESVRESKETELRNSIDKLFCAVDSYRRAPFFKDMLRFCASFKQLAPYNAMLVKTQMPSARYVLSARNWDKMYNRRPRNNARPLVILQLFGPVSFVFEIGDTEPEIESLFSNDDDITQRILDNLASPFLTTTSVDKEDYGRLVSSLPFYGIALERFSVASTFGAQICKSPCKVKVGGIEAEGNYIISINDKADDSTAFASICHELGHYFCHHLTAPGVGKDAWWKARRLTWEQKEFEAEIVSYIVCERHGVGNKSWEYLSHVLGENGLIPSGISIDVIFKAANEVERMVSSSSIDPTSCHLYAHDKAFKSKYDKAHRRKAPAGSDENKLFSSDF